MKVPEGTITVGKLMSKLANCSEDESVYFEEASDTHRWIHPITAVLFLTEGYGCGSEEHVILRHDREI